MLEIYFRQFMDCIRPCGSIYKACAQPGLISFLAGRVMINMSLHLRRSKQTMSCLGSVGVGLCHLTPCYKIIAWNFDGGTVRLELLIVY